MLHLRQLRLAGALGLLSVAQAAAQHGTFQMYGTDLGLTNSNIVALDQDRRGYLWVNTEGGLFRYDGDRFQLFAVTAGKNGDVQFLHSSEDGQFWVAATEGLFRWTGNGFAAVAGFEKAELTAGQVIGSDAANLYVATLAGLRSLPLKGGPTKVVSGKPSRSVLASRDGTVWFGCGALLCSLRDGQTNEWGAEEGVTSGPWHSIAEDGGGRLWIRSNEGLRVRDKAGAPFREVGGLPRLDSTHNGVMRTDRLGRVLAPHTGGLAVCADGGCRNIGAESGLRRAELYSVLEDREGSLWIGYSGHGLARWLGRTQWSSFGEEEGLVNPAIWRIVRGARGDLWIGTNRGLFRGTQKDDRWTFKRSEAVGERTVYGLAADPDGAIWVATYQPEAKGLVRYDAQTGRRQVYPASQPIAELAVNDLSRGEDGTIWVATKSGVLRLRPGAEKLEPAGLPVDGASVFEVRPTGRGLFAAGRKGLYVESGALRRLLTVADGLKDNAVQSTTIAPDGAIWITYFAPIGTTRMVMEGGRVRMQHYSQASGLPSDTVYSQFFDAGGRHWLATGSGVAVRENGHWVTYDVSDGLVWNDCNAHAYRTESDGTVWIGTSNGLARYRPSPRQPLAPPPALITAVHRNEKPTQDAEFSSHTYSLALRFTSLYFERQSASFRYRLGTSNDPWIQVQGHEVRFATLPAGWHRFEVQAEGQPGEWGPPAKWDFRIRPAWYNTRAFRFGAAGLLGLLVWIGIRRRDMQQRAIRLALETAVAERTAELRAAHDELEQRVKARTRDLENEIAERKMIEHDLQQAKELAEESSRVKGDFLTNMSHELRTPLNAILGYSELLEEEVRDAGLTVAIPDLQKITASGRQLLALINDVLELSKIESGRLNLELEPVAVADVVREATESAEPLARKHGNRFVVADRHVQDSVLVDPARFRQSLLNLLNNACKFTRNGSITLTVEERVEEGKNWSCWEVRDSGIGIPAESMSRLFQNFSQVDASTTRKFGGTGLGLALSQRFCRLMGGHITVESEPGKGSVFTIHIPMAEETEMRAT